MGRFDDALRVRPEDLLPPAQTSVQSSLYQRLRKPRGRQAGTVAWLLVRAAQPDHAHHADALAALSRLGISGTQDFAQIARATLAGSVISNRLETRELAQAIVDALDAIAPLLEGEPPDYVVSPADLAGFLAARAASGAR